MSAPLTRPFAADTSDATLKLQEAIETIADVTDSNVFHATVDGVEYEVRPTLPRGFERPSLKDAFDPGSRVSR